MILSYWEQVEEVTVVLNDYWRQRINANREQRRQFFIDHALPTLKWLGYVPPKSPAKLPVELL